MEKSENREEELLQKHRKERKELQAKIQALKKSSTKGDKKRKKEIAEEILQLESQLEKRQNEELEELKQACPVEETEEKDEVVSIPDPLVPRVSKAQRRRDKKAIKEKEREEMIIAAEKENIHGPRNIEIQKIKHLLKERSLMLQEIPSDGNCLYCAVDDQLKRLGESGFGTGKLRWMTSQYLLEHKCDFLPFLSHPDTGDVLSDAQYEDYCNEVANTPAWGGEVELRALSHVLKCCFEVIQATGPSIMIGEEYRDLRQGILTFHRHMYSLGEHYNSVKSYTPQGDEEEEKKRIE